MVVDPTVQNEPRKFMQRLQDTLPFRLNLTHKIEQFTIVKERIKFLQPGPNGFDSRWAVTRGPFRTAQPTDIIFIVWLVRCSFRFVRGAIPQFPFVLLNNRVQGKSGLSRALYVRFMINTAITLYLMISIVVFSMLRSLSFSMVQKLLST
jgi:hypothetical protein